MEVPSIDQHAVISTAAPMNCLSVPLRRQVDLKIDVRCFWIHRRNGTLHDTNRSIILELLTSVLATLAPFVASPICEAGTDRPTKEEQDCAVPSRIDVRPCTPRPNAKQANMARNALLDLQ